MKLLNRLLYLLSILFFSSCNSSIYLPTKQSVMVFKEKADIIVSANIGLYDGFGLEGGYAFTDNIGLYTSFNRFNISKANTKNIANDFIWDNELILYKKFNSGFYSAINTGVGFGSINANNRFYKLDLNRQFLVPSIGYTIANMVDVAVSARFSRLAYYINSKINIDSNYDYEMFKSYFELTNLDKSFFCIEPALTAGLDLKYLQLKAQYTWIEKPHPNELYYKHDNLVTTISLNIDKIFFPKKTHPARRE